MRTISTQQIATLLHLKEMRDCLSALDQASLSERERFALDETQSQLDDRAAFSLQQHLDMVRRTRRKEEG